MKESGAASPHLRKVAHPHAIWPVAVVSLLTWVGIVVCIDPAGSYPQFPQGPGLTVDEIFNVEQGVYLVEQSRSLGWLNLIPGTAQAAFDPQNGYNPDHPPLGRYWLGFHHHLTWWLIPPADPEGIVVPACARTGSATAFALTIFLLGSVATSWSGFPVGVITAVSLVLMPRLFGHAHLASLETITNLTCTAAVLAIACRWNDSTPPTWQSASFAGVLLGLALLTKIQAILIPLPVICWTLWRWRFSGIKPLFVWGLTALFVFITSWPYLWFDPLAHLAEYFGRTTNRATIYVWYLGQRYADKSVPWHYPFLLSAITVPVVLQCLGLLGLFGKWLLAKDSIMGGGYSTVRVQFHNAGEGQQDPSPVFSRDVLLVGCLLFPLLVFSLPGVAVYDGERLFLTSFPLWAIFIGRGWQTLNQVLSGWITSRATVNGGCALLLLSAFSPLIFQSPCHLCYYNGIDRLFPRPHRLDESQIEVDYFEVDYWGVGITRELLASVAKTIPADSTLAITPTLHQFQADDYRRQSPLLRRRGIRTVEASPDATPPEYRLVYRRQADLSFSETSESAGELKYKTVRGGRLLAYFLLHPQDSEPDKP